MKKVKFTFLLGEILCLLALSAVISAIATVAMGAVSFMSTFLALGVFIFFIVLILYFAGFGSSITNIFSNQTERRARSEGFGDCATFYANGCTLMIDVAHGKLGYIGSHNPRELQVVSAKDISNIQSSFTKEIFGGTRYVYFEFYYANKRVRIPTFYSRQTYSINSTNVQEAIAKADLYRDLLIEAQGCAS